MIDKYEEAGEKKRGWPRPLKLKAECGLCAAMTLAPMLAEQQRRCGSKKTGQRLLLSAAAPKMELQVVSRDTKEGK